LVCASAGRHFRYAGTILEAHANGLLEQLEPGRRCRRAVEEILHQRLASGAVPMAAVARVLGMSRQTLYRQLRLEGTT
jgi:transcriptional regulator of acetoin/glycerol metabolism